MSALTISVDERTMLILERVSRETGRSVEDLASAAVESEAIRADARTAYPGQLPRALTGGSHAG